MKNIIFFCCIVFFNSILAQDTIIKSDNAIIIAKVSEINSSEIKYKRYAFPNGPTYIELKSNVKMIVYANGVKEVISAASDSQVNMKQYTNDDYFKPVPLGKKIEVDGNRYAYKGNVYSERKIQQLLLDTKDKQIAGYVARAKQAQKLQYIGFAAIPLGVAGLLLAENAVTTRYDVNGQYSTKTNGNIAALSVICIGGSISCPIVSGVFKRKRKHYNTEAVNLYNERY
ncbi:MAG: hypothetical protein WAQ28_16245 [Bacteroidia bacterium]